MNDPINPSDSILQAFAKLQGQLNSVSQAVKWVDISTVATIHPTITNVDVQLARINGLLYLKGHFNLITIPTERINAFVITDPLYKVYAMATSVSASRTLANPVFYFSDGFNGGLFFTSTDCRNAAAAQTAVQNIVVQNNTSNRFNPIQIQPVVLGDLVIK
ncbi:hypothetical protein MMP74_14830 [Acinetobacter sp. NIPH 1869]|uniref:hypothetical protein n=1 Tax=Acinetobacter higginsii TaxID=70347 RepID=UPI001F4B6E91|nr:hypothetical protein [Acinetobacter higginsii]MCH7305636.1 hypothetical protein [Acinetobacter higginsii]